MTKNPSKKRAPETNLEPESDDHFAFIAGYTSGGAPYGISWGEQERVGFGLVEAELKRLARG